MHTTPRSTRSRGARLTAAIACAGLVLSTPAIAAAATVREYDTTSTDSSATNVDGRGQLLSHEHLRELSAEGTAQELKAALFDSGEVRYGVDIYRLVYRTVDAQGRPTTASGLLVLPRNHDRQLRTVSFAHGTELNRNDAPSVATDGWGSAPAITYASAGFAAVAPDYLGLGLGAGSHPWFDLPSETTASLDMLRATRAFVPVTGRELRREVLVTGFSQGASATLGLARALQNGEDKWFQLGALAPISGAYDFQHAELPALLNHELDPMASVVYAAYFFVAWNRLHHLYDTPGEVFQQPYASTVEQLFDGAHTGQQVVSALPTDIDTLLTPHGVDLLRHPTGRLAEALRVADGVCTDWTPDVPIRLYKMSGDEQATTVNTEHCAAALRSHGAHVQVVDVGDQTYYGSRHLGSNVGGTAAAVRWFIDLH